MALINATADSFNEEIAKGLVLVDFYADWCGPCKMLSPVLEELATELNDVKIVKINVDNARELAKEYGVSSIPHLFLLKNGEIVHQDLGFKPKEVLLEWVANHK